MRTTTWSLTLALLCSAASTEASAQQGKGGRGGSNPPGAAKRGTTSSPGLGQNGSAPAVGARLGGTRSPWERSGVSQADWLLANRLASIRHMRDVAERNGNERLREQADKLEELARRQYVCRTSEHGDCEHLPKSP